MNRRGFLARLAIAPAALALPLNSTGLNRFFSDLNARRYLDATLRQYDRRSPEAVRLGLKLGRCRRLILGNHIDARFDVPAGSGGRLTVEEDGRCFAVDSPVVYWQGKEPGLIAEMVLSGTVDGKPWERRLSETQRAVIEGFAPDLRRSGAKRRPLSLRNYQGITFDLPGRVE